MTMLAAWQVCLVNHGMRGGATVSTRRLQRAYGRKLTASAQHKTARRHRFVHSRRVAAAPEGASTETVEPLPSRASSEASTSTSECIAENVLVQVSTSNDSLPMARATLLLVPLLWATYNPAMRFIYESNAAPSPAELTAVRMLIALVPFSLILANIGANGGAGNGDEEKENELGTSDANVKLLIRAGLELGALNAAGTAFQAYGLELTSATRAGFLLSTINVLVPLGAVASGAKITPVVFGAVLLASLGVCISETSGLENLDFDSLLDWLGLNGGLPGEVRNPQETLTETLNPVTPINPNSINGDLCCLSAAFLYSAFTVRLGKYASRCDPNELSAAKALAMTVLCVTWWGVDAAVHNVGFSTITAAQGAGIGGLGIGDAIGQAAQNTHTTSVLWSGAAAVSVWSAVGYSALAPGALANVLQTRGQAIVPPEEAQLIFATTPVFNAVVASLVLGETATPNTLIGGFIILTASVAPFLVKEEEESTRKGDR